jgi:hypothetical protein
MHRGEDDARIGSDFVRAANGGRCNCVGKIATGVGAKSCAGQCDFAHPTRLAESKYVYILGYGFDKNNNERLDLCNHLGTTKEAHRIAHSS